MPRWPRWKRRFEQFSIASGLAAEATVKQVSTFLYCMGEEAEEGLLSTRITKAERKVYWKSWTRTSKFKKTLFKLVEHCEYGALRDQMVRDRIVVGIKDSSLSEQLQRDANLTLDSALKHETQQVLKGKEST